MIGKKEKNWCYKIPIEVNLLVTYGNDMSKRIPLPIVSHEYKLLKEFIDYVKHSDTNITILEATGLFVKNKYDVMQEYLYLLYSGGQEIKDINYISTVDNMDAYFNHPGQTLWSGRYCAILAFIFTRVCGETFVLANKRGNGTPDYQGLWNCPCGFLEGNETAEEGCAREVKEETGVVINPKLFLFQEVETNPKFCNNSNVGLRYMAILSDTKYFYNLPKVSDLVGGERDEVEQISWINVNNLTDYQWAFNHDARIKERISKISIE